MKWIITSICWLASLALQGQTQRISFRAPLFYPEGVAYHSKADAFFVGSVKTGTIAKIDRKGTYTVFYQDSSLKSSFGMKTDSARNCLWVCTADPGYSSYSDSSTYKKKIRLIALDLGTGRKVKDFDLSYLRHGKHFANDLTLDGEGNIYITDSYSPVIYKVDKEGHTAIWAEHADFAAPDIGLNGIVWHPDGYILAVNNSTGALFKVQSGSPATVSKVQVPAFFPGADGLLIDPQGHLILVQNKGVNKVFRLASHDNWQSAAITGATASDDRFQQPSTCVMAKGNIYVVNSKMDELDNPGVTPSKEFSLQQAVFRPMK